MRAIYNVQLSMPNFLDERPGRRFTVLRNRDGRNGYALHLETDGFLRSWALAKAPSPDPAERRHAVEIVPGKSDPGEPWDCGDCTAVQDVGEGLRTGKLLFDLRGYKLRGSWTLVRTRAREWLLIKETGDAFVQRGGTFPDGAVLASEAGAEQVRKELQASRAPRRKVHAADIQPMLAEVRPRAFSDPDWIFELKYDGFRALAGRDDGRALIQYRRGSEATRVHPDLAAALHALPVEHVVLDGEIVVLDEQGRPNFQRLQKRALLTAPRELERAVRELPATLFVFDLLAFDEWDLRPLPLAERKRLLRLLLPDLGPLRYVDHFVGRGEEMFRGVRELGLEGIMAKRAASSYRSGRSADWVKVRADRTAEFAVVGFSAPEGSRSGFGSLHLAYAEAGSFVYVGRAGSGFSEKELRSLREELERDRLAQPPCSGSWPKGRGHTWVSPRRVVEVRYKEITEDGLLRAPVFLRFRDDKAPFDCARPGSPPAPSEQPEAREVVPSNLDKVFWPEEGYTKGDLLAYYRAIAPWLLPYLRDRPVVLTRFPDGIAGKSFFQKDAPDYVPAWIRTARMRNDEGREIDHFVCDDAATLLYVANLGTIPLHVYAGRADSPQHADWTVIDLDPKSAPFEWVIRLARALHELCEEIGLPSFCKTSGQAGLHVLLPLAPQCTHEQARDLALVLANVVEREHKEIATLVRAPIEARRGRVYLDCFQNGYGKTIAAPFSARPVAGATVSMPLRWSEVKSGLDPRSFTIKSAPQRMRKLKRDPLADILGAEADVEKALDRLGKKLRG
ncbi:MAG TPA: DNA ligase D [Myxococcales bacterium]|nr:DNA ligase D [Myxococcales bacterium]